MPYTTGQVTLARQVSAHLNSGGKVVMQLGRNQLESGGRALLDESAGVLTVIGEGSEEVLVDLHTLVWIKLLPDGREYI